VVVLIGVLFAVAIAAGAPVALLGFGVLAMIAPAAALAGLGAYACWSRWRKRRAQSGPDDEAAFLQTLGAELAGGASLRAALVVAVAGVPRLSLERAARAAGAGLPAHRVAADLELSLPVNGRLTSATWLLAADGGGPAAALFQSLAARAAAEGELRRERRALTAQARASAWVVAGIPAALLLASLTTGRVRLGGDPVLSVIVLVGVTLQAAGVGVVVAMVRRAER
jgi:tight adherence protein B